MNLLGLLKVTFLFLLTSSIAESTTYIDKSSLKQSPVFRRTAINWKCVTKIKGAHVDRKNRKAPPFATIFTRVHSYDWPLVAGKCFDKVFESSPEILNARNEFVKSHNPTRGYLANIPLDARVILRDSLHYSPQSLFLACQKGPSFLSQWITTTLQNCLKNELNSTRTKLKTPQKSSRQFLVASAELLPSQCAKEIKRLRPRCNALAWNALHQELVEELKKTTIPQDTFSCLEPKMDVKSIHEKKNSCQLTRCIEDVEQQLLGPWYEDKVGNRLQKKLTSFRARFSLPTNINCPIP